MTSDWLGGGLIFALAAVLWLIYLIPTWFRRNEFLSTERNVVRLQQTLRILAETSEVPDEIRAEANARSVAEQQRLLKKANAQNLLAERAGLQTLIEQGLAAQAATERERALQEQAHRRARTLGAPEGAGYSGSVASTEGSVYDGADPSDPGDYETIVLAPTPTAPTSREVSLKLRRARAATSGILLLALVVTVLGAVQTAVNGAWIVLVIGAMAATLCVTRLSRLAKDARTLRDRGRLAGEPGSSRAGSPAAARASRRAGGARPGYRAADHTRLTDVADLFEESRDDADAFGAPSTGAGHPTAAGVGGVEAEEGSGGAGPGWKPVPLPKPLYVGHRRIEGGEPVSVYVEQTAQRAEEALRAAARDSESALRAAYAASAAGEATAEVSATTVPDARPTRSAAPNRFASMGVVDPSETGAIDVDQVLARRRAG